MNSKKDAMAVLVAAWLAMLLSASAVIPLPVQAATPSRPSLDELLDTLVNGAPEERLEAAGRLYDRLPGSTSAKDASSSSMEEFVDSLDDALRLETDDWIARTLLESFVWNDNPPLNRLFRDSLGSASVNVRAVAVKHFAYRDDPEAVDALESLWERDLPSWMRPELIEALAEQGSATHLEDFIRLSRDDDSEMRAAAIMALETLAREESIPALVRVVHDGVPADRAGAVRALGAFPSSDLAFAEVLRASQSALGPIRGAAVWALGRFDRVEAGNRLIALLESPPDPDLRGDIVASLEKSTHPDATAALLRLLHQPDIVLDSWIASTTLSVLHNRDDPLAAPGLRDLEGESDDGKRDDIGEEIEYLSRDRSDGDGERTVIVTTGCSFEGPVSAGDPDAWHVAPPHPLETIRCWEAPDRPASPEDQPRIPAGRLVRITDHFEAHDETWVEIEGRGADDCWVPLGHLEKGPGPPKAVSWPRRLLRQELDLDTAELDSSAAIHLAAAGMLKVFEPGDEIAGVALSLDALDAEQVALARALLSSESTPLDMALRLLLRYVDPEAVQERRADEDDEEEPAIEEDDSDDGSIDLE